MSMRDFGCGTLRITDFGGGVARAGLNRATGGAPFVSAASGCCGRRRCGRLLSGGAGEISVLADGAVRWKASL